MQKLRSPITLRCPNCNRETDYDRKIDPEIPNSVKTIISLCSSCGSGDFEGEIWLDVCGLEVPQTDHDREEDARSNYQHAVMSEAMD